MKTATYGFKPNRGQPSQDAQAIGEELERIRQAKGTLTPAGIVEESRPADAVLHKDLDLHLTNKECASRWHLHKARNIVNVITVVPERPDGKPSNPVAAFPNIITQGKHGGDAAQEYKPIHDVLADPVDRAQLVQRALQKLLNVQREFRYLRELETVWNAVDDVATSLGAAQ